MIQIGMSREEIIVWLLKFSKVLASIITNGNGEQSKVIRSNIESCCAMFAKVGGGRRSIAKMIMQ